MILLIINFFKIVANMKRYMFNELPNEVLVSGTFDDTCVLELSDDAELALLNLKLKISIAKHGRKEIISNFQLKIKSRQGKLKILVGNNDSRVLLDDESSGVFDLRLWRKSKVVIGKGTTSNGIRIICDDSEFICGEDCMFSDNVLIQGSDQHGIVDLISGEIVNSQYKSIKLGDHVWLGRGVTIMPEVSIGSGCVIGTQSVVTRDILKNSIAAGVPAKIIKNNMSWSRSPVGLDKFSKKYIDEMNES